MIYFLLIINYIMKFYLEKKNNDLTGGNQNDDNKQFIRPGIYLKKSKFGGKGVFTSEYIKEGETIEIDPFLKVPSKDISEKNILKDYIFKYDDKYSCLVLGYGSMYNHKDDPNVQYYYADNNMTMFEYKAIKDIQPGEELFISYGADYWSGREIDKII